MNIKPAVFSLVLGGGFWPNMVCERRGGQGLMAKVPELSEVTDRANCSTEMTRVKGRWGSWEDKASCSVREVRKREGEGGAGAEGGGGGRGKKRWKKRSIMSPPMVRGRPCQLENNCWVGEGRGEQPHMIDLSLIIILIACIQIPWVWFVRLARVYMREWSSVCVYVYIHIQYMCVSHSSTHGSLKAYHKFTYSSFWCK